MLLDKLKSFLGLTQKPAEPVQTKAPVRKARKPRKKAEPKVDYEAMTKVQLVELGESKGVQLKMRMKKSEMIETIKKGSKK